MGGGVAVGARRGVSDNFPGRRLLFGAAYYPEYLLSDFTHPAVRHLAGRVIHAIVASDGNTVTAYELALGPRDVRVLVENR
jgi:hypothetical protein